MSTPLRRRVMNVLFDKPRKGWVAALVRAPDFLQLRPGWAPVAFVHVPQREFTYADDVVSNPRQRRAPTAFARKHLKVVDDYVKCRAHYGRWGVYETPDPKHLLVIAQDHEALLAAIVEQNNRPERA